MNGRRGTFSFLLGAAAGAGLMALLDPGRGARRRTQIREKSFHGVRVAGREVQKQARRLGGNVWGTIAESRSKIRDSHREIPDDQLYDRVRSQLGHVVHNIGALEMNVSDGKVIVRGPVLHGERDKICQRLDDTRGVRGYTVEVDEVTEAELKRRAG